MRYLFKISQFSVIYLKSHSFELIFKHQKLWSNTLTMRTLYFSNILEASDCDS